MFGKFYWRIIVFGVMCGLVFSYTVNFLHGQGKQKNLQESALILAPTTPALLEIPAISVRAPVIPVGLSPNGTMGTAPFEGEPVVAWYKEGVKPGEMGNSLISGHLDTKTNPRSLFYNLQKLNPGDSVIITDTQGHIIEFKVTGKKVYGYKEKVDGLFAHVSDRNLNLITCTGKWLPSENTYDKRLVVFAKMID